MAIKTDTIKKLEEDINRKNEIINERERALETAASKYSETFKQLDEMQRRVSDLQTEVSEKDDRLRQLQSSLAMEGDVKKMLVLCQDEIREKDEKLKCFEIEGQNLSRKQGEMEKSLRNAKKEVREKEAEITRLVAAKDQLTKSLEEARNAIKKHEGDVNSASKTLSAMQAVSQSSADKIAKLESDLNAKVEELSSQRRALDASWTEISELKRTMAQLKAERDDLQKRIGEDTSKAIETETTQRDAEYRVATLTANIKQLQDSLQRQMSEAAGREERLREEASEMRKRWQEAITSRENLALDQSNATAPLLRQISTLQDQLRTKTEAWQRVESSLSERALRAENMIELAEQKRQMIEEQLRESKQQYTILTSKYEELLSSVHAVETTSNDREAARLKLAAEKSEIESKLNQEAFLNQSLQSSIRELESKYKSELHDFKDVSELQIRQLEFKVHELKSENELLMRDIEDERSKRERGLKLPKQTKERTDITEDKEDEHVTRATSKVFQTMMPGLLPSNIIMAHC
jgi:chromosome segregation ATPase